MDGDRPKAKVYVRNDKTWKKNYESVTLTKEEWNKKLCYDYRLQVNNDNKVN